MKRQFLFRSLINFFVITILFSVAINSIYKQKIADSKDWLRDELQNIQATIEYSINSSFMIVYSVASHISIYPQISHDEFNSLAVQLFKEYNSLKNIAIAPNYKIKYVYPIEGNTGILGVDYRDIPDQFDQVQKAINENRMVLAGPLDLIQGGVGLIARVPVYDFQNSNFWGIVSSVIDFDKLMDNIERKIAQKNVIIGIFDDSRDDDKIIYGNKDILSSSSSVSTTITLPDRVWSIALSSKDSEILSTGFKVLVTFLYLLLFISIEFFLLSVIKKTAIINYNILRFKDFTHTSTNWIWETDSNFKIIFSAGELNVSSWGDSKFIIGKNIVNILITPQDSNILNDVSSSFKSHLKIDRKEWWIVNKDEEIRCVRVSAVPYFIKNKFAGYRGLTVDITDKKIVDQEMANYLSLVDTYIPISQTDLDGVITKSNSAYCQLSGYKEDDLIGQTHQIMRHPSTPSEVFKVLWKTIKSGKEWEGEVQNIRPDESSYWFYVHIKPLYDIFRNHYGYIAVRQDITAEKEIYRISETDTLTGIYNRRKLNSTIGLEIYNYNRTSNDMSVIMVDIDHFKRCNDNFGHLIGDEVIKSLTRIISAHIRKSDIFGRWGGEEFLIICPNTNRKGVITLAETLRKKIEENKIELVGHITCSLGVASTSDIKLVENIIDYADKALYNAKNSGRNCVKFYSD